MLCRQTGAVASASLGMAGNGTGLQGLASEEIVSYEPATGGELWRGQAGDVDEIVVRARLAWPAWAAQPLSTLMELVRRFANEVRKDAEKLATVIARETDKPLWKPAPKSKAWSTRSKSRSARSPSGPASASSTPRSRAPPRCVTSRTG